MRTLTDLEFVNLLRESEIAKVVEDRKALFVGKDLLEIGSGAGAQLLALRAVCKSAMGIDNSYRGDRLTDIIDYDGRRIPFPDASFDIIFSSHVLEHIRDQLAFHREMQRVLRCGGIGVHIMPSAIWRFWSSILHYPAIARSAVRRLGRPAVSSATRKAQTAETPNQNRYYYAIRPRRHGDLCGWLGEHYQFSAHAWRLRFRANGWNVRAVEPMPFFATGHYLLNERLSWRGRRTLAATLGPTGNLFIVEAALPATTVA